MRKLKAFFFGDLEQVEKIGFPITLLLVIYGFFLASVNQTYYDGVYTMKGGLICSLQQLLMFCIMILSFFRAYKLGIRKKDYKVLMVACFFGLLFLFGLGEKIRWGQFIFDLPLPEFFQKYNGQGHITIHNLHFNGFSVNKIIFGSFLTVVVVIYSLLFPYLYSRDNTLAKYVADQLKVPVPRKDQIAWYAITVFLALMIPVPKRGELVQYSGVFAFAMFFFFPKNRKAFE